MLQIYTNQLCFQMSNITYHLSTSNYFFSSSLFTLQQKAQSYYHVNLALVKYKANIHIPTKTFILSN